MDTLRTGITANKGKQHVWTSMVLRTLLRVSNMLRKLLAHAWRDMGCSSRCRMQKSTRRQLWRSRLRSTSEFARLKVKLSHCSLWKSF